MYSHEYIEKKLIRPMGMARMGIIAKFNNGFMTEAIKLAIKKLLKYSKYKV